MTTRASVAATLPTILRVGRMLSDLFGKRVAVTRSSPATLDARCSAAVGVYAYDDGSPSAMTLCDLAFASYAGAALSLIPASVAEEGIATGMFADSVRDNLHEIFNVCATLFNTAAHSHVTLRSVAFASGCLAAVPATLAAPTAQRLELGIHIPEYGSGKLAFTVA